MRKHTYNLISCSESLGSMPTEPGLEMSLEKRAAWFWPSGDLKFELSWFSLYDSGIGTILRTA